MVTNRIIFFATSVQPNPEEIDYWVDLSDNPYGGSIKYFNGTEWVRLAASGGTPDLSNYYTKTLINNLLNNKADVGDVDSKVDDEEVKDVIKDIQFNTSNPNNITMVMFKYDGSDDSISLPIASTGSAGIVTSKDFLDFVKQHQLLELHTEMIDTFADIRAKYLKKLIAGLNIEIDQETNVISASGDLAVQWDNITGKPDFKPVATSGDYNDLINKLKPGKDVSISEDNVISIAIDSDSLERSLATLQSNIDKEAATARAAELTIGTNLLNEIDRSTLIDTQHTNAINKEVQDRKEAIATEVSDRNAAILVETNRAKAKEEELDNKITDHTNATNAALALKADKSDTYTKAQVDAKLSGAYKVKGSSTFEALPKDNNVVGDVYNITNAFNLGGKHYDAGTNVVWTEEGWDALSGSFDTTAIEGSIQEVADNLAQEILDRTQADTTINNNVSSLSNRVKVNEDKLTIVEETLNSNITQLLTQKVDKVEGKDLSTNDYTTPEKNKLAAIEAEANKYVLPAATASALGGVKIGSNITLADDGTISITKTNVTSALGVDPTTKYVTLDTDLTITGSKTFTVVNINTNNSGLLSDLTTLALGNAGVYKVILTSDELRPTGSYNNKIELGNTASRWKSVAAGYFDSGITTGTAPIQVSSTTLCTNLNADMIDGYDVAEGDKTGIYYTKFYGVGANNTDWLRLATLPLVSQNTASAKYVIFEIVGGGNFGSNQYNYSTLVASTRDKESVKLVKLQSNTLFSGDAVIAGYVVTSTNVEIWLGFTGTYRSSISITCKNKQLANDVLTSSFVTTKPDNFVLGEIVTLDAPDWYGVSWSETSSNPDCTRIGNMDMHRTLPILSMMKPFAFNCSQPHFKDLYVPVKEDFTSSYYSHNVNDSLPQATNDVNIMIKIPEFWYTDDYNFNTKTHNLKICQHAKSGWNHHKEAYVSAYELYNLNGRAISKRENIPTVNFTRANGRTWARANGFDGEAKWNLYTYEEHRAICHLFLVEYATRNSQKAVNTTLTAEGFRQGGLGSGCTTGTATINGDTTYSFIPTGSSDSLGSGSGEVTVTIQLTDSSGSNTSTITRECNRYRGIENPFGHIWKHADDVISVYNGGYRTWYKSIKPNQFADNENVSYKPLTTAVVVTGYKTEIRATPTCDFFAAACTNESESTYWCDYNWDNTDTSEHCLLIGGRSDAGGEAGLFYLYSADGVGRSSASIGSRLTYLPWAE